MLPWSPWSSLRSLSFPEIFCHQPCSRHSLAPSCSPGECGPAFWGGDRALPFGERTGPEGSHSTCCSYGNQTPKPPGRGSPSAGGFGS